ncbi:MAG: glycerate kinase [Planctomycetota bacterium]
MKIVIAPDSFKESLPAQQVCQAIERGIHRVYPHATIDSIPMADGGEGTVQALIAATGGKISNTNVSGPTGDPVVAAWGTLGGSRTAVVEMASASGLALVSAERRNPLLTTTFGTGELILAAIESGATRIIIGIGGSATTDGGTGSAQAIGVRFYDAEDRLCASGMGGAALAEIARIDMTSRDQRIASSEILVACDVDNPLCGPRGAAAVYSPQKGATPEQVKILDHNLNHLVETVKRDLNMDIGHFPGAGAAGGLGAGLVAFFGATIQPGVKLVMEAVNFNQRIARADLVITGEGKIDAQSMMGKVIEGVGRACQEAQVPVIALVGAIGEGAEETLTVLESYHRITPPGTPLAQALARAAEALESTTVSILQQRNKP